MHRRYTPPQGVGAPPPRRSRPNRRVSPRPLSPTRFLRCPEPCGGRNATAPVGLSDVLPISRAWLFFRWSVSWPVRSGLEEGLDRAALVHGLVALGGLVQWQGEVEDLAGVDGAVPIRSSSSGRNRRTGAGPPSRAT